jgi:hypothetical protein
VDKRTKLHVAKLIESTQDEFASREEAITNQDDIYIICKKRSSGRGPEIWPVSYLGPIKHIFTAARPTPPPTSRHSPAGFDPTLPPLNPSLWPVARSWSWLRGHHQAASHHPQLGAWLMPPSAVPRIPSLAATLPPLSGRPSSSAPAPECLASRRLGHSEARCLPRVPPSAPP